MDWTQSVPLGLIVAAAALYGIALRRAVRLDRERIWRAGAFYGGLVALLLALEPPLEPYADTLFVAHMAQHVLLLTVAPPLLVLGRPWLRVWRPFPLAFRRPAARAAARAGRSRPFGWVVRPAVSWTLLNGTLLGWHVPALYSAAVRSNGVHVLEHVSFLATALLFWAQVLGAPPLRARLDNLQRTVFLVAAMLPGWVLAIVLAYAQGPFYSAYADLAHHPWGLSALTDQKLAAGVMWVPGSVAYVIALLVTFYRWLDLEARAPSPASGAR